MYKEYWIAKLGKGYYGKESKINDFVTPSEAMKYDGGYSKKDAEEWFAHRIDEPFKVMLLKVSYEIVEVA